MVLPAESRLSCNRLLHCELGSVLRWVSRLHVCWGNRVVQHPDDSLEVLLRVYGSSNLA
jgi:hypothetical protein